MVWQACSGIRTVFGICFRLVLGRRVVRLSGWVHGCPDRGIFRQSLQANDIRSFRDYSAPRHV